ncbi:signal peptidase I [Microbulbifer sp. ZKSA004]|uniref:signal peptidase I n=1 Tax=Microbulbifer sp. ZKSA004 TaxID=3243389 RepID=UPI00403A221A
MKYKMIFLVLTIMLGAASSDALSWGDKYKALTESMVPAIPVGSSVIVDDKAYIDAEVARGDIVVFTPLYYETTFIIMRVVGLPGETIEIKGERVYIDGSELKEDYAYYENARPSVFSDVGPSRIKSDSYYLMGDNRYNSLDSRNFGTISKTHIVGKVTKIVE